MFEAQRWHSDPRYHSPMITHEVGDIFIGDIVVIADAEYGECYAKVLKFMAEVTELFLHLYGLHSRIIFSHSQKTSGDLLAEVLLIVCGEDLPHLHNIADYHVVLATKATAKCSAITATVPLQDIPFSHSNVLLLKPGKSPERISLPVCLRLYFLIII